MVPERNVPAVRTVVVRNILETSASSAVVMNVDVSYADRACRIGILSCRSRGVSPAGIWIPSIWRSVCRMASETSDKVSRLLDMLGMSFTLSTPTSLSYRKLPSPCLSVLCSCTSIVQCTSMKLFDSGQSTALSRRSTITTSSPLSISAFGNGRIPSRALWQSSFSEVDHQPIPTPVSMVQPSMLMLGISKARTFRTLINVSNGCSYQ